MIGQRLQKHGQKVREEVEEVEAEINKGTPNIAGIKDELGDVFFALVNVARFYKIEPEEAVYGANQKFYRRFSYIENCVRQRGKSIF